MQAIPLKTKFIHNVILTEQKYQNSHKIAYKCQCITIRRLMQGLLHVGRYAMRAFRVAGWPDGPDGIREVITDLTAVSAAAGW